eukprot:scpid91056/ scgid12013/ 
MSRVVPPFDMDIRDDQRQRVAMESLAKRNRFGSGTMDGVQSLIDTRTPGSTKRTTETWLKVFYDFCSSRNLTIDLSVDQPQKVCEALALWYVNTRGREGQPYQRPSLQGMRAALEREICSIRPWNIISDKEFKVTDEGDNLTSE